MARKILTIEYDTDQQFFDAGDESLLGYLVNEFNNHDLVASLHEVDAPEPADQETPLVLPPISPEQRLHALQDAVAQFNDNFKHALLHPLTYPEPPYWTASLVRDLNDALAASKVS